MKSGKLVGEVSERPSIVLYMKRSQREYFGPLLVAQLSTYNTCSRSATVWRVWRDRWEDGRTRQARANRVSRFVDQNAGIIVESDVASIFSLLLLMCSDYHSVPYVSSLDFVGDTESGTTRSFLTKRALFLYDNDDAIT